MKLFLYSNTGTKKAEIKKLTYNGTFMGECFVTTTLSSPEPLQLDLGDYTIFRNERFTINYTPPKEKKARKGSHGEAFVYENIKLNSLADELTRCDFSDYVLNDNLLHYSGLPVFRFYANTVQDLADRLQANLDRLYKGTQKWMVKVDPSFVSPAKEISIDKLNCWNALTLSHSEFGANFIVKGREITIGTAGIAVGKVFGYGKGKGLYDIQQVANQDAKLITRLRVFGSGRNMPNKYYNKLKNGTGKSYIPELYYAPELRLPDFPRITLDPYIDSPNIAKYGIREGSVFFDGSDDNPEIFPSLAGMTKAQLNSAGIQVSLKTGDNGNIDEVLSADNPTDNGDIPEDPASIQKQFKIYLKDLGFDLSAKDSKGEYIYATADKMQIALESGMCTARKFDIVANGIKKDTTQGCTRYLVECNRFVDDTISMAYPNRDWQIKPNDKFVILGIDLPEVYIKAAAQKLLDAGKEYLPKVDKTQFTYVPKIDEIFMARNPQIGETIKEGDIFNFDDTDLNIDCSVIIQTLKIEYNEGAVPTYEITLSDKRIATTIEKMQESITQLATNQVGITLGEVKSLIMSLGTHHFLSRLNDDSAEGNLTFVNNVSVEKDLTVHANITAKKNVTTDLLGNSTFTSGQFGSGFRMWKDATSGQSYAEFDNLMVRREMLINTLTIAEIKSVGGQILVSLAAMECSKVELSGSDYKCYFENDNGTIPNQFAVNDQVICRRFDSKKLTYYWRRVLSVGTNFIVLSKTDADGSGVPAKGDELIQFGNRTDTNRQSAIMISAYGADAPSIKQYVGINTYNLIGKEVISQSPKGYIIDSKFFEIKTGSTSQSIDNYTNKKIDNIQIGGRNLFRITNLYNQTGAGIGQIYPTGYANNLTRVRTELLEMVEKTEYTITNPNGYHVVFHSFDSQKKLLLDTGWISNQKVFQYTPVAATAYVVVLLRKNDNTNLLIQEVITSKIKIEKGNKATDWSPSPEDVQAEIEKAKSVADKAQADAIKAQTDANTANSKLGEFANDNLLIPSEKQDVLMEWQIMQGEKPTIIAQAQTYGMAHTAYETAYNNLSSYITPLLANLTINSVIVGNDFRTNFNAYYDAKIALLKLVTDKAKALADAAQAKANSAQTTADAAKTAASTAQSTADQAKTSATTANNLLSDISNDNKLTANEKQNLKKEWDSIISEYTKNIVQANLFGVATTNYASSYNSLSGYITPLLTNLGATSDIVGTTFRANFKAYYDNRTDLLNAIATKAKQLADAAQNTANLAQTNVTKVEASIKVLDDSIKTKVSQTDYNSLAGRVSSAESTIIQQGNKIESTVTSVQGKNAVFKSYNATEKPTVPYAKNDIWVTFDGEMLQSTVTRLSGVFTQTDWKPTTKYTDDSAVTNLQIGGRNYLQNSRFDTMNGWNTSFGTPTVYIDAKKGKVVRWERVTGTGDFMKNFTINKTELTHTELVYYVIAKRTTGAFLFGGWLETHTKLSSDTCHKRDLGDGWIQYWTTFKSGATLGTGVFGLNSVTGTWLFHSAGVLIGNKPADWQPAPEDVQTEIDKTLLAASKAQSDASKAQTDANYANTKLGEIANDNLLTPSEKQETLQEWQIIQSEKSIVIAQAQTYAVAYASYETVFNNLNSYITPLLSNLTVNSTIVGNDFRAKFKAYYDAKIALLKLVTDKAKALADAAQTKANSAQTTADTAKTAASTAQSTADSAKSSAATANNLLSDISNDNKLTANEKQNLKKEWDSIASEYTKNIAQANSFGVATTNYANSYNSLSGYITPFLNNIGTTSDIVGTTFRANFKAYYDNRTDLLNAIATKAKLLADTAQTTANNIQVGGRNLVRGTASPYFDASLWSTAGWSAIKPMYDNTENAIEFSSKNGWQTSIIKLPFSLVNKDVVLSYEIKVKTGGTSLPYFIGTNSSSALHSNNPNTATSSYVRHEHKFKGTGEYFSFAIRGVDNSGLDFKVLVKNLQLEEGNKATSWSIAPEDVQESINKAQSAANTAQSTANTAQTNATTANTKLGEIANDNLLTPSEKQSILQEWQIIQGEKPTVIAQAQTYTVAFATYETAYNNLNTYITPLLANLTVNTAIVGNDFRAKFKAYYDVKILLLKLVTDKAKALADAPQTKANSSQTAADQAKTLANTAQSTADTAKTNATTANNLLADISNDNKFTPNEKLNAKREWDILVSEYSKNLAQANTFGVASMSYGNSYVTLYNYITPLLSNLNVTSDIVGTTFRANFKNYYDARTDLLNAIATKTKLLAEIAQNYATNGYLYCRGTAKNRDAASVLKLSNTSIYNSNIRGLRLTVIGRQNLNVISDVTYDVYSDVTARANLANTLNSQNDSVIVVLTSYDAIVIDDNLANAMIRCGGSGVKFTHRNPYAFVGIPNIGIGNGIEVYQSDAAHAPYAEISTKIENGVPVGVNTGGMGTANTVRTYYSDITPTMPLGGHKTGDLWYKISITNGCYTTNRWNGSAWVVINEYVSKAQQTITDNAITNLVTRTGVNSLGNGENLWSKINQTADKISLEVGKVQVGARNFALNTSKDWTTAIVLNNTQNQCLFGCKVLADNWKGGDTICVSFDYQYTNIKKTGTSYYQTLQGSGNKTNWANGFTSFAFGHLIPYNASIGVSGTIAVKYKFTLSEAQATNDYFSINIRHDYLTGSVAIRNLMVERATNYSDWSPAPEDIAQIAGSSLSIKDNKITLASKTIELKGTTISEAIKAETAQFGGFTVTGNKFESLAKTGGTPNIFLDGTNGTAFFKGGMLTPFKNGNYRLYIQGGVAVGTYGLQDNNNVVIPGTGGSWNTTFVVPFSPEYNGFRTIILNDQFDNRAATGIIVANAPVGKYFYEDGTGKSTLTIAKNEGVEMIGFGESNAFHGWIVLNRFNSNTQNQHGFTMKAYNLGMVKNNAIYKQTQPDPISSISKLGEGHYRLFFRIPFSNPHNYMVFITCEGTWARYGTVINKGTASFDVYTGDDSTANDSDFNFMIIPTTNW